MASENLDISISGIGSAFHSLIVFGKKLVIYAVVLVDGIIRWNGWCCLDGIQAVTGLSLGELTALIFAGAISFEAGLQLVVVRAAALQMACNKVSSCSIRVIGLDKKQIEDLCNVVKLRGYGDCSVSNKLFPIGCTIGSSTQAINFISNYVQQKGGRSKVFALSGAFHSSYMSPATEQFAAAVNKAPFQLPKLPVYSNVTGKPYSSVEEIQTLLVEQLTSCVVWDTVMENMMKDYPQCSFVECGPGSQVNLILKKLNKQAECINYSV
ncbi:probable malonyl-CoA-acyl carrier protein transacylase, mitochondrial isoform X2 [Dysidea avara]|uniref:probable malonyl-CoA-acyl carrier protein transacylase, mitochondrial isoform X2 n=1 Tax=Dysidea avara TaxID=196820 RepID=UPI0033186A17